MYKFWVCGWDENNIPICEFIPMKGKYEEVTTKNNKIYRTCKKRAPIE